MQTLKHIRVDGVCITSAYAAIVQPDKKSLIPEMRNEWDPEESSF